MEKTNYRSGVGERIEVNKVMKNTYMLLGMTMLFSAAMAWLAVDLGMGMFHPLITIGVYFVLLFAVHKTANSALGLPMTFAFTGWLGFTLGPILAIYSSFPNGEEIIAQALGGTGLLFVVLSGYVMIAKPNMTKWIPFIGIGLLVAFVMGMINYFFLNMPIISTLVSSAFLVLSSALLMWQTGQIINGGEKNYILATITIFVSLYNIFLSLLNLLSSGDE